MKTKNTLTTVFALALTMIATGVFAAEPSTRYDETYDVDVYGTGGGEQVSIEHVGSVLVDTDDWLLEVDGHEVQKDAAICLDGDRYASTNPRDTDEGAQNYLD